MDRLLDLDMREDGEQDEFRYDYYESSSLSLFVQRRTLYVVVLLFVRHQLL